MMYLKSFWNFLCYIIYVFLLNQYVSIGHLNTVDWRDELFNSLMELQWSMDRGKTRLNFTKNNVLHRSAYSVNRTFSVAFLIIVPRQISSHEKVFCYEAEDKSWTKFGSTSIDPNEDFVVWCFS